MAENTSTPDKPKVTGSAKFAALFAKAFPDAKKIDVVSTGEHSAVAMVDGTPKKLSLE